MKLRQSGAPEQALREMEQAIRSDPTFAEGHHQLGNLFKSMGRFREAADSLGKAAVLAPDNAVVFLNLGVALLEIRAFREAADCFGIAVKLEPGRAEAHNILGHVQGLLGRSTEAISSLETALRLRPGYAAPLDNLGRALSAQGRADEAIQRYREALQVAPSASTHSNLLYSLNLVANDPVAVRREHETWGDLYGRVAPTFEPYPPLRSRDGRRLRVGYVSPDFVDHSVAYFIGPVLANHDRAKVEVFCYSSAKVPDLVTQRLSGLAENWRDIARLSDSAAADMIARDGIDVLVDLSGHTGESRLLIFARKPAPVQVTWIGYPNTTGLAAMDYRLTDAVSDPPGLTEAHYTEELVRLPDTFSCYEPCQDSPPVGPLPAATAGTVTFGCFNNFAKVRPEMLDLWGSILSGTPGSRLLLKSSGFADPHTRERVANRFRTLGVEPDRILFDAVARTPPEHLRLYHRVDIALDTHPYNGATTTCEALWMGVPVVTLAGTTHASRVGASFLGQMGLDSCVTSGAAAYRAACMRLAADIPRLAALRYELRDRMQSSSLCDGARFTRRLEETYERLTEAAIRQSTAAPGAAALA